MKILRPASAPSWLRLVLDSIERWLIQLERLPEYTVATVPDAVANRGKQIIVTDETGGLTMAFSDGTNWLRTSDNAVIS